MNNNLAPQCKSFIRSALWVAGLVISGCGDDKVAVDATGGGDTGDVAEVNFETVTSTIQDTGGGEFEVVQGGLGSPCVDNRDCDSGYCIQGSDGFICTTTCVDECPAGFGCKGVASGSADVVFVCVPNVATMCKACIVDRECNGGLCLPFGGGHFCSRACTDECDPGFQCEATTNDLGKTLNACLPTSGTCDCSPSTAGAVRACENTQSGWACDGVQVCQIDGWTACSARIPIAEICDFVDNDCDDEVDEAFKNADGIYATNENCGYCGNDCTGSIPNAQAKCDAQRDPPECVVDTCLPGYFELSPFFCGKVPAKLCNACDTAASCVVEGAECASFDDGNFCTVPCTNPSDCPEGYGCVASASGGSQCVPSNGSCVCDGDTVGLQRGCEKTHQSAGGPLTTCVGLETCAAEGWGACVLGEDVCDNADNDCDGVVDNPWVNADGIYYRDENCGICGNNCKVDAPENATRVCDISGEVPHCVLACAPGTADIDNNPSNGCECVKSSDTDLPDGFDQNCDGIDGELGNAIFVAKTGSDSATGAIDDPMQTVQGGLDRAAAQHKRDVYVATGVYSESVTLRAGVTAYGGYSGDFHERDIVLYETALIAAAPTQDAPGAVNAVGLGNGDGASGLVGTTVFGFTSSVPGESSYAIWIVDSGSGLRIADNTVYAGNGAPGAPGSNGASGTSGVPGVAGKGAKDIGDDTCGGSDQSLGGSGGPRMCGAVDVGGGTGGTAICPDFNEASPPSACPVASSQVATAPEAGVSGKGAGPGAGGGAGLDVYINRKDGPYSDPTCADANANCSVCHVPDGPAVGTNGAPGAGGTAGAAGAGCATNGGDVVANRWVAGAATSGTDGAPGSGGGGGGAAGGVETLGCASQPTGHHDIGGSGGGGGSGGCGALGGTAGGGGGGSFAIFIVWSSAPASTPVLTGNELRPGTGGPGGIGGLGGTGGSGGAAGPGGVGGASNPATFCAPQGGSGGQGGQGGHGGGGGGGCGGASFGLYVAGGPGDASWKTANTIRTTGRAGAGGVGGPSLGAGGGPGLGGAIGSANY